MNHRHLFPDEIDLLVDGDAGFGLAPLRAHLAECAECRQRHDDLRVVADALEGVPHFTPHLRFADRVMTKVQVIEPWHVAVVETARRIVPSSTPMRVLAAAGVGVAAVTISASAAWLAFRADLASWLFDVALDRARQAVVSLVGSVASGVLGSEAGTALARGDVRLLAVTATVLGLATLGAIIGFRRLAAHARAGRG